MSRLDEALAQLLINFAYRQRLLLRTAQTH